MSSLWQVPGSSPQNIAQLAAVVSALLSPFLLMLAKRLYQARLDSHSSSVDSDSTGSSPREAAAETPERDTLSLNCQGRGEGLYKPDENEDSATPKVSAGEKEVCRQTGSKGSGQGGDQQRKSSEGPLRRETVLCDKCTQLFRVEHACLNRVRGEQIRKLLHAVSTGSLTTAGTLGSKRQLFFQNHYSSLVGSCLSENCNHHFIQQARANGRIVPDPDRQPSLRPSGQSFKRGNQPSTADSDTETVRKHSFLKRVAGHREVSSNLKDSSPLAFGDNICASKQQTAQHQCQLRRHLSAVIEKTGHSDTSLPHRASCSCLKPTVGSLSDFIQPLGFKRDRSATLIKPKSEKSERFFRATVRHNWVQEKARDCEKAAAMDMSIHLTTNSAEPMPTFDDREAVNLSGQAKTNKSVHSSPQICVNMENACADLVNSKLTSIEERINALCANVQEQCSRQHSKLSLALFAPEEPVYPFPVVTKRSSDTAKEMGKLGKISDIKLENMPANVQEDMTTRTLDSCVLCRLNAMTIDSERLDRQLNRRCCLCSIKREVLSQNSLHEKVAMSSSAKDLNSSLLKKEEITERRQSCPGLTTHTNNPENGTEKCFSCIQQQIPKVNPVNDAQPCKCFNAHTGLVMERKENLILSIKRAIESDLYTQMEYLKTQHLKRTNREASGVNTTGADNNIHPNDHQNSHQNHQNAHQNGHSVFQRSYNGGSVNKNLLSLNTDSDARTNSAADIHVAPAPERRASKSFTLEQNRALNTDGDARQNSSLSVHLAEDASKTENRILIVGPRSSLDTDGDARQSSTTSVLPLRRSQPRQPLLPEIDKVDKPASSLPPLNTDEDVRQGSRTSIKPASEKGSMSSDDRKTINMSLRPSEDTDGDTREESAASLVDDDVAEPARVMPALAPAPEDSQNSANWTQDSSESTVDTSPGDSDSEVSSQATHRSVVNKRRRAASATAEVTSEVSNVDPKKDGSTCSSCDDTFSTANCSASTTSLTASSGRASPLAGPQGGRGEADKAPDGLRPKNKPRKSHQTESKEQQKCGRCQTSSRLLQRVSPPCKFVLDTSPSLFSGGRPREQTCFGGLSTSLGASEDSSGQLNAESLSEDDIRGTQDLTDWVSSTLRSWLPDFNNSQKNKSKSNMSSTIRHEEGSQTEFSFYDIRNLLENETLNKWSAMKEVAGQWTGSNSCPHSCASSLCNFRRTLESWKQQLLSMHAALDASSTALSSCALCKDSVPHEQGSHNCHTMHLAQDFWRTVLQFKRSHLQDSKCPFMNYSSRLLDPQSSMLSDEDIEFVESCVQRCSLGHEHCCSGDFSGCVQHEFNPFDSQPEPSAPCVHVLLDDVDLLLSRLELIKQAPEANNSSPRQTPSMSSETTQKPEKPDVEQQSASKRRHPAVFECSTTCASESVSCDDDSFESKKSKHDKKSRESLPSKTGVSSDHSLTSALNTEFSSASGLSLSPSVNSSCRASSQGKDIQVGLKPPDVLSKSQKSNDVRKTLDKAQKGGSSSNRDGSSDPSVKSKTSSTSCSQDLTIVTPDIDVTLAALEYSPPKAHSKLQSTEPQTKESECQKPDIEKGDRKIEKTEHHMNGEKNLFNASSVCKTKDESITSGGDILSGKQNAGKMKEIVMEDTENGDDLTKHKDSLNRAQSQGFKTLQANVIRCSDNECHQSVDQLVTDLVPDRSRRPLISGPSSAAGCREVKEKQHGSKALTAQLPSQHKSGEYLKDGSLYSKGCSGDGKKLTDTKAFERLTSIRCDKTGSQPSRYNADFKARQPERKEEGKEKNMARGVLRTSETKSKILADSLSTAEELFQRIQRIKQMSQELQIDKPDEMPAGKELCNEKVLVLDTVKNTIPETTSMPNPSESRTRGSVITNCRRPCTQTPIVQNISKARVQYVQSRPLEEMSKATPYFTEEQMINRTKALGMYALRYLDHIENKIDACQSLAVPGSTSASEGDINCPEGQLQEQKKLEGKPQTLCKKAFRQCSEPRLGTAESKGKSRLHTLLNISPCVSDDRFTTDCGASGEKMTPKLLRFRAAGRRSASHHSWESSASSGSSTSKSQDLPSSREPSLIVTFRDIIALLGTLQSNDPKERGKALVTGSPKQATAEKDKKLVKFAPSSLSAMGKATSCNPTRSLRGQAVVRKSISSSASLNSSAAGSADNDMTITQAFDQLDKVVNDLLTLINPDERSLQLG